MSHLLKTLALVCGGLWLISKFTETAEAVGTDRREQLASTARRLHAQTCDLLGVPEVPLRFTEEVANAASNGREVLVNLRWFDEILQRYCNDYVCVQNVVVGILGHEVGHHLYEHAIRGGDSHFNELEADRMSGRALARSGGTSHHLEALLTELGPMWTSTHPGSEARVQAVREGYTQG